MKILAEKALLMVVFAGAAFQASAHDGPKDPAAFQAKMAAEHKACEDSQFNTKKLTLPNWTPGQPPPQLNADQKALVDACREAGIMGKHPHHHDKDAGAAAKPAGQ